MNYQEIHDRIIFRAKIENRTKLKSTHPNYVYYESHHILPKCIFPEYKNFKLFPWNKVLLTGREHFVTHLLLTKIYPNNNELFWAVHRMTSKNKNQSDRSKNHLYSWLKEKASRLQSSRMTRENNPMFGKTGKLHPNFGVLRSLEFKLAQSKRMLGEKNNNFGNPLNYKHSSKTKVLISNRTKHALSKPEIKEKLKKKINCKYCSIKATAANITRWHNDNCRFKVKQC